MNLDAHEILASLYPKACPVAFFKIKDVSGNIFREGYNFSEVVRFEELVRREYEFRQKYYQILQAPEWISRFRQRLQRQLKIDEIRIAFRPASFLFVAAFVDDIQPTVEASVLIETSRENWQGHFFLSRPSTAEEVLQIHRHLSQKFGGDPGAHAANQARRLPSLGHRVIVKNTQALQVDEIISYQKKREPPSWPQKSKHNFWDINVLRQMWARKLIQAKGDKSSADFKLAVYLLKNGWTYEDVCEALMNVSDDLENRKGRHIDGYLDRTVRKADMLLD